MKIEYLGHSSFLLVSDGGTRIVTDPFGDVGFDMPRVEADVVTVSHAHYDHANLRAVKARAVLSREGNFRVGDFAISAVRCYHDDVRGAKRGENLVFRFEADGVSVCHLGDLGEKITDELLLSLGRADVLLVPVGGNYTIDAEGAEKLVRALSPAIALPMHYFVKGLTVDIAPPDDFLRRFSDVRRVSGPLEVHSGVLPRETEIILMGRRK